MSAGFSMDSHDHVIRLSRDYRSTLASFSRMWNIVRIWAVVVAVAHCHHDCRRPMVVVASYLSLSQSHSLSISLSLSLFLPRPLYHCFCHLSPSLYMYIYIYLSISSALPLSLYLCLSISPFAPSNQMRRTPLSIYLAPLPFCLPPAMLRLCNFVRGRSHNSDATQIGEASGRAAHARIQATQ